MRSLYDDNIKKFNLWCRDNTSKAINIVFRPYDNLVILNDLIDDYLLKNKKILYIKKFFDVFKFKYNEGVEYITFDTLYSINKFYDLIILDDVSFYSEKRDIEIIEYISFLMKRCSKIILCSFEYILKKEASINLAGINNKKYFLEPRIIKSRLNFLNSMPKILYDYFQWFIKERRNVIIYTPNEIYTSSIFNYYIYVFGASKNINIVKDSGFILNNIRNKEKINIIITHNSMSNIDNIKEFDLTFYFCDEKIFDSKKIIFSCAKLNSDKLVREVLLLCQKETYNVSQAKKIARSYNQIICQEEI